jgi:hypothetical protein
LGEQEPLLLLAAGALLEHFFFEVR